MVNKKIANCDAYNVCFILASDLTYIFWRYGNKNFFNSALQNLQYPLPSYADRCQSCPHVGNLENGAIGFKYKKIETEKQVCEAEDFSAIASRCRM